METEISRLVIMRIVAHLLGMATLAERASAAPAASRRAALHFLHHAEAVTREFVACAAYGSALPAAWASGPPATAGDGEASSKTLAADEVDTTLLAVRFRAFALVLILLLTAGRYRDGAPPPRACMKRRPQPLLAWRAVQRAKARDSPLGCAALHF